MSTRLLARNDINMELRWVTSHCSGMSPSLSYLSFLSQRNKPGPWSAYCDVSQLLILTMRIQIKLTISEVN